MKIIIALLLSLFLAVPATSNNVKQESDTFNYVSFGASQTVGYGLHGFIPEEAYNDPSILYTKMQGARDGYYSSGYYYWSENSFPQLIADKLQEYFGQEKTVNFDQRAINSMRAYDLAYILDEENFPEDAYISWRLGNEDSGWIYDLNRARNDTIEIAGQQYSYQKEETNLRQEFRESIINADLITYDLGVNDFGVYLSNRISDALSKGFDNAMYDSNLGNLLGEEDMELYNEVKAMVKELLEDQYDVTLNEKESATFDFIADTLSYAFVGFVKSFDASMKTIYELNPDVEVVVVSIQNLMEGYKAAYNGKEIDFGEIFGYIIDLANAYTAYISPYSANYYYANVSENGRQEYFVDDILSWDGNIDNLPQEVKEAFDCYESKLLVRTMVTPVVKQQINSFAGNLAQMAQSLPDPYKTMILNNQAVIMSALEQEAIDEVCDSIYYLLAKSVQISSQEIVISLEGASTASSTVSQVQGIITDVAGKTLTQFADNVDAYAIMPLLQGQEIQIEGFSDTVKTYIDTQLATILATDEAKSGFFIGMVSSFANCFFCHPNAQGHKDTAEIVYNAYLTKNNARAKAYTSVHEYVSFTLKQAALLSAQKASEVVKEAAEAAPAIVNEVIETAKEVIEEVKEVVPEAVKEVIEKVEEVAPAVVNEAIEITKETDQLVAEEVKDILTNVNDVVEDVLGFFKITW